ncbi:MAG: cohesin domain-containing protein [Saprospiraceae bacterium]
MMDRIFTRLFAGLLLLIPISISANPTIGRTNDLEGFTITLEDFDANQGDQICLDASVSGFMNILGMQFSINYDPAILQFNNISNTNLTGLSPNSFGNPSAGNITMSWSDPNAVGLTLADGTVVFEVCFTVVGTAGTTVTFSDTPTPTEIVDGTLTVIGFTGQESAVTVNGNSPGGGGGGGGGNTGITLTIEDIAANQGDQVCLDVTASNFTNILSLQNSISYDPAVLQFSSISNTNLAGLSANSFGNPSAGKITMSWADPNNTGLSVADGTVLFEICFNVIGTTSTTVVDFSNTPTPIKVVNGAQTEIGLTSNSGTVTVTGNNGGGGGGGGNENPNFTGFGLAIEDVSANQGDQICLDVVAYNFNSILGMQYTISYDQSKLQFSSIANTNLAGLSANSFGNPTPGKITLSWSDPNAVGVSVADGTVIYEVCFNVLGTTSTTVTFTSSPTIIEIIDSGLNEISFEKNDGVVTLNGGGGGGGGGGNTGPSFTGFGVVIEDTAANQGDKVCLDVTAYDFVNILGTQFTINYDPGRLQFVEIANPNLVGLSSGAFGNPSPGNLTFSWSDPNAVGVTVPDETVIFQICFNVLGNNTSTTVSISGTPTGIEIIDSGLNEVPFNYDSGTVTISDNGSGPGFEGFGIIVGDKSLQEGDSFCVPVSVQEFVGILGMQFTISYNATELQLDQITGFNLNGLAAASFNSSTPGTIRFTWDDPNATGVTLNPADDPNTIFELCFTVIGTNSSQICIVDTPVAVEITASDLTVITPTLICGNILVGEDPPPTVTATITGVSCPGENNGSIALQVSGVGPNYSYQWSIPGLGNANTASGLSAGNVTVTVTDNGTNLQTIETFTVPSPAAMNITPTIKHASCSDATDGSISLAVTGGTGPFTYNWSPTGTNTSQNTGLASGVYNVTVTDRNSCVTTAGPFIVESPSAINISVISVQNVQCASDQTGAIAIAVNGGTPPYSINWNGNLPDNTTTQSGLSAGSYSVVVSDANNCSKSLNNINILSAFDPIVISLSLTPIPNTAGGTGSINASISGGTGPGTYGFSWTGPGGFTSASEDLNNLTGKGEYCLQVTDNNNCVETICVNLGNLLEITSFNIVKACENTCNGAVNISTVGGLTGGSATFAWQRVGENPVISSVEDLTNVCAGTYRVTIVKDGQEVTGTFEVTNFELDIQATTTPSTNNTNGTISINISGGNSGYSIVWDNGDTGPNANELPAGEICATITSNANGCATQECFIIPSLPFTLSGMNVTETTCSGRADGLIAIVVVGGIQPYSLSVAGRPALSQTNAAGTFNLVGLASGSYNITVKDALGSELTPVAVVPDVAPIAVDWEVVNDTEDPGGSGSITLDIAGGRAPYSIGWNIPVNGPQPIQLACGTYTPIIEDANGCVKDGIEIEVLCFTEEATTANVSCPGDTDGSLSIALTGAAPYQFKWKNLSTNENFEAGENLTDLAAGNYSATITDNSGAVLIRTYVIGTQSGLRFNTLETVSSFNGFAVSCNYASDGVLRAVGGGNQGPLSYEWLNEDGAVVSSASTFNSASPGVYTIRVFDDVCVLEETIEANAPAPLAVEAINLKGISCADEFDGQINVLASGGISPYIYRWSSNDFGDEARFLGAGDYTVTVTDKNNCVDASTFTIAEPAPLEVVVETEPETENCNGAARAIVTGGTEPYSYNWIKPAGLNTAQIAGLCNGTYFVEVTDANGCTSAQGEVAGVVKDKRFPCFEDRVVLTPDGDGLNDALIIFCSDEYPQNHIEIYNRWGQLVYEEDNYDCTELGGMNCFAGETIRGEALPEGAYYWVLQYVDTNGDNIQMKGSLTILRE